MCGRYTLTVQEQNLAAVFNLTVGDGGGYAIRYNIAPTQNVPVVRVVETPYNPPSTTVQPDVSDISALVNTFAGRADQSPGAFGW